MTIKGVAALAGVSAATVSKVINGKDGSISEATRDRIRAVIEQTDYVPYRKLMDKVSGKTNLVAVMVPTVGDIFNAELVRGAEDLFFSRGYGMLTCNTDENPEKENAYIRLLGKNNVRGILRFPVSEPGGADARGYDEGVTSVVMDNYKHLPNELTSYFNNREGALLATRHLIAAGHRRIGYITRRTLRPYQMERIAGYYDALAEAGIPLDESIVCIGDEKSRFQCGYSSAKQLMLRKVTAIFCSDDRTAAGVYRAMHESGLKVPHDISVVGFDNSSLCELLEPNLTSVEQSAYDIGYSGAKLLCDKLAGLPLSADGVQVQPSLVVRSSVMPPGLHSTERRKRCIVIGEIRADIVMDTDGDGVHTQRNAQRVAHSMQVRAGGWAVRKAGELLATGAEVHLAGCVGDDAYGRQVYNSIAAAGIKTDGVVFLPDTATGTAVITETQDGARGEIVFAGANAALGRYPRHGIQWMLEKADLCLLGEGVPAEMAGEIRAACTQADTKIVKQIDTALNGVAIH